MSATSFSEARRRAGAVLLLLMCGAVCIPANAADSSVYLVLTTDYVWRGVTQTDGDAATQVGVDVAFDTDFYAGVWASTIAIDNGDGRERDTEVTYYAGYAHDVSSDWTLGARVVAYTYPGQSGSVDYSHEEIAVSANLRDRAWLEYAYSPDLYNSGEEAHNLELYTEWPAGEHLIVGGGAGYHDVSNLVGTGYGYWEVGITLPISRFDLDLRYHDTNRNVPVISTGDRADSRVVLTFRASL